MKRTPPSQSRTLVAIAALVAAPVALAQQAGQALVLAFDDGLAVPLGGWTSVGIALLLAMAGLAMLRRRGASRFAQWCVLAAVGGALAVGMAPRESTAKDVPDFTINLLASPATLNIPPPGLSVLTIEVVNTLGKTTVIKSIVLSAGAYAIGFNNCPVGSPFAPAATCTIQVSVGAG